MDENPTPIESTNVDTFQTVDHMLTSSPEIPDLANLIIDPTPGFTDKIRRFIRTTKISQEWAALRKSQHREPDDNSSFIDDIVEFFTPK